MIPADGRSGRARRRAAHRIAAAAAALKRKTTPEARSPMQRRPSRKRLPSLPSPAMLVALLALFAALGGTSYAALSAGSITSRELRDGTIRNADVKKGTLRAQEIKRDSLNGTVVKEEALDASRLGNVRTASRATVAERAGSADGFTRQLVVSATGVRSLDRGGVVAVTKPAAGRYEIVFDTDVSACVPVATLALPPAPSAPAATPPVDRRAAPLTGEIAAGPLPGNVRGVQVATADSAGVAADRAFQLAVSC